MTTRKFAYYTDEAGEEMGSVPFEFITQVTIAVNNKKDFVVSSVQPFTKSGSYEVGADYDFMQRLFSGLRTFVRHGISPTALSPLTDGVLKGDVPMHVRTRTKQVDHWPAQGCAHRQVRGGQVVD